MKIDAPSQDRLLCPCGIAVMAKASKAGRTKTRLGAVVGPRQAAIFNTAFLMDIAENLIAACIIRPVTGYVAFGPPEEVEFFDFLPEHIARFVAWEPTFGETLKAAIRHMLAAGHDAACVLNSDSPTLPPSILAEATQALAEPGDRIVLGPSNDGGYYLLGMKAMHDYLFEDIAWSTERVTQQTLQRAAHLGLDVHLLPQWYDVDDALSFEILHAELTGERSFGPPGLTPAAASNTRALLENLEVVGSPHHSTDIE